MKTSRLYAVPLFMVVLCFVGCDCQAWPWGSAEPTPLVPYSHGPFLSSGKFDRDRERRLRGLEALFDQAAPMAGERLDNGLLICRVLPPDERVWNPPRLIATIQVASRQARSFGFGAGPGHAYLRNVDVATGEPVVVRLVEARTQEVRAEAHLVYDGRFPMESEAELEAECRAMSEDEVERRGQVAIAEAQSAVDMAAANLRVTLEHPHFGYDEVEDEFAATHLLTAVSWVGWGDPQVEALADRYEASLEDFRIDLEDRISNLRKELPPIGSEVDIGDGLSARVAERDCSPLPLDSCVVEVHIRNTTESMSRIAPHDASRLPLRFVDLQGWVQRGQVVGVGERDWWPTGSVTVPPGESISLFVREPRAIAGEPTLLVRRSSQRLYLLRTDPLLPSTEKRKAKRSSPR
ncbi:MAG: hypothetical protein AAGF12_25205 [Myxococcota bacterium]